MGTGGALLDAADEGRRLPVPSMLLRGLSSTKLSLVFSEARDLPSMRALYANAEVDTVGWPRLPSCGVSTRGQVGRTG